MEQVDVTEVGGDVSWAEEQDGICSGISVERVSVVGQAVDRDVVTVHGVQQDPSMGMYVLYPPQDKEMTTSSVVCDTGEHDGCPQGAGDTVK